MKVLMLLIAFAASVTVHPLGTADNTFPLLSCPGSMPEPPCATYWRFDTVFIGTVKELINVPFPPGPAPDWQQYYKVTATLTVDEIFKGDLGSEVVFEMGDCYFEFKKGEKYLVYARNSGGKFHLGRNNTPTALLSEATEHLDFIRSLSTAPSGGRIFGDVYDHRTVPTLRINEEPGQFSRKIPGVSIYLKNGEKTYQTITDATGHFELTRIPPGEYDLSTDLPKFLSGTGSKVLAVDKGCMSELLSVQATGSIKGRLVDAERKPVERAVVSIFSAEGVTESMFEQVRPHFMTRSETNVDGYFRFEKLVSGRYYIAVNMVEGERVSGSPASIYPRIFYPGVAAFADATAIELGDGVSIDNVVLKLPSPLPGPAR